MGTMRTFLAVALLLVATTALAGCYHGDGGDGSYGATEERSSSAEEGPGQGCSAHGDPTPTSQDPAPMPGELWPGSLPGF